MNISSRITRTIISAGLAAGLLVGGTPILQAMDRNAAVATAEAVPAKTVVIKKIPNKKVRGSARATVKPKYSKGSKVKVRSARLTVKHGKKTVATNKASVKLKAGTYKVTTTVKFSLKGKKKVYKTAKKQTLKVTKKKGGSRYYPSGWDCPRAYPVKGNQSGIYHVPGGRWYDRTRPEVCFSSPSAARAAGYRASKNG